MICSRSCRLRPCMHAYSCTASISAVWVALVPVEAAGVENAAAAPEVVPMVEAAGALYGRLSHR